MAEKSYIILMYAVEKIYKKTKRVTVITKLEKLEDAKKTLEFCQSIDKTRTHVYRIIQEIQ